MPARCQPSAHPCATGPGQRGTAKPFRCKCFSFSPSFPLCLHNSELKALPVSGRAAVPTLRGNPQLALFLQMCLQPTAVLAQLMLGWAGEER